MLMSCDISWFAKELLDEMYSQADLSVPGFRAQAVFSGGVMAGDCE
jgi:hypothetical protein